MPQHIEAIFIGHPGATGPQGPQGPTGATGAAANTSATSTTSRTIGTGSQTFTVQSGRQLSAGNWVTIANTAAPNTNWMYGQITAYSGTTLTVNVVTTAGSGTFAAWTIGLSGPAGSVAGVVDTTSVDLTLAGGVLSADVVFGTAAGTVAQGTHVADAAVHQRLVWAGSITVDPPSIAANSKGNVTVSIPGSGILITDTVTCNQTTTYSTALIFDGCRGATDGIVFYFWNPTGSAVDAGASTWMARVVRGL